MELKTIFFESPYALPGERPRTAARGFCLNSSPQDPPSCRWLQARRPAEAVRPCSQKRARCEARYRVENVSHRERHTHGEARARFDCPPAFVLPPRRIARSRFARSDGVPPSTRADYPRMAFWKIDEAHEHTAGFLVLLAKPERQDLQVVLVHESRRSR